MGSSRPTDRSIGEATFLPQWMKGKLDTRFDYTDSTFSPPADDFFFVRYPKHQDASTSGASNDKEGFRSLSEFVGSKTESAVAKSSNFLTSQNSGKSVANIDFSKHPLPCQRYIPFIADKGKEPKIVIANQPKVKYQTSDDEFNNDKAAECGRSIVSVASQIMSFGKFHSTDSSSSNAVRQKSDDSAVQREPQRKVSKSLPATPLASPSGSPDSSPKARRRVYGNRFFTGAFVTDGEKKNGWLLSSILGQSRELVTNKIEEEDEQLQSIEIPARALSRKKSISSQNLTYIGNEDKPEKQTTGVQALQAKPSELREMNFWSPTSM